MWVHHDGTHVSRATALSSIDERLLDPRLDVAIDRQHHVSSILGRLVDVRPANRQRYRADVRHRLKHPIRAAQFRIIGLFEAVLPLALGVNKAQHLAGQLPLWVDALAHCIKAHPSEILLLDKLSLLTAHFGGKHLVTAWLTRDVLAKILTHITTSDPVEDRHNLVYVCHSHRVGPHGIDRLIHDKFGGSSTIHGVYLTALGAQTKLLDLLAIGLRYIVIMLQQLHIPQAQYKHHK